MSLDLHSIDRKEASKYCMQHWVITGTQKNQRHLRVGVAAETIDKAIEAVRVMYAECRIYSVTHQGPIEVVVK